MTNGLLDWRGLPALLLGGRQIRRVYGGHLFKRYESIFIVSAARRALRLGPRGGLLLGPPRDTVKGQGTHLAVKQFDFLFIYLFIYFLGKGVTWTLPFIVDNSFPNLAQNV